MGVVELLHQPATVGQSDLNVGGGLGGVKGHRGTGLGLTGSQALLGVSGSSHQIWGCTGGGGGRLMMQEG